MKSVDGVGPRVDKDLVAALEHRSTEILSGEVHQLEVGPGGAIEDQNALREGGEIGVSLSGQLGQEWDAVRHEGQGYRAAR